MLIAQITDTHIKEEGRIAYRKVDTARHLEVLIDHINGFRPKIDVVIATGDMTDSGSKAEFGHLAKLLKYLDVPLFMVPGNHDIRSNMRFSFPDHSYAQNNEDFIHYVIDEFPLCLIGLDSTTPGKPYGSFCQARLSWLKAQLDQRPDRDILIFMHHPPFRTGIDHMDCQNMRDYDAFIDLIGQYPSVRHVTCGHVHRAVDTVINGIGFSIAPNAAHSVSLDIRPAAHSSFTMEPATMRLFKYLGPGRLISHQSFVGHHDGPHAFYETDGRLIE